MNLYQNNVNNNKTSKIIIIKKNFKIYKFPTYKISQITNKCYLS